MCIVGSLWTVPKNKALATLAPLREICLTTGNMLDNLTEKLRKIDVRWNEQFAGC